MNADEPSMPHNPTLRQMIEGMPLAFNREAAAGSKGCNPV